MAIEFNCPHCNATIKAADHSVGKKGTCRRCQKELVVPQSREMASPPQNIGGQSSISTPKIEAVRGGDDVRNFQTVTASTEASITSPMPAGWKRRNFQTVTASAEAPPLEAETNTSPSRELTSKRLTWRVVAAGSAVVFLEFAFGWPLAVIRLALKGNVPERSAMTTA